MEKYYKTLDLRPGASKKQIRKAYLHLAKKYHPDKNHQKKGAEEQFKQIQQAYDILTNYLDKQVSTHQNPTHTSAEPSINWAEVFNYQQQKVKDEKKKKKIKQMSWFISFALIAVLAILVGLVLLGLVLLLVGVIMTGISYTITKHQKNKTNT